MRKTLSALNAPEGDPSEPPRQPAPHGMRRGSMVRVVSESAALFDALAITATSLAAEYFYNGWVLGGHPDAERALGAGAIAAIATILIYGRMLLYRSDSVLRPRVACLRKMITGWAFVVVGLIVATFLTKTSADYSRGWAMTWAVATPAVIVLGRFSLSFGARKIIGWGHLARHVAIVGQGPVADRIAAHLKKRSPEIVLIGLYDDRLTARSDGDLAPMGTLDDLVAKGQRAQLDEIIVVDNGSTDADVRAYYESCARSGVRIVAFDEEFNYSRACNRGAEAATGELLLFLNNDIEVLEPGWLAELVRHAVRPEIGAVGAKLLYPDRTIQHGGIVLGIGGVAGHSHLGVADSDPGYFCRMVIAHEVSAVTGSSPNSRRSAAAAGPRLPAAGGWSGPGRAHGRRPGCRRRPW